MTKKAFKPLKFEDFAQVMSKDEMAKFAEGSRKGFSTGQPEDTQGDNSGDLNKLDVKAKPVRR